MNDAAMQLLKSKNNFLQAANDVLNGRKLTDTSEGYLTHFLGVRPSAFVPRQTDVVGVFYMHKDPETNEPCITGFATSNTNDSIKRNYNAGFAYVNGNTSLFIPFAYDVVRQGVIYLGSLEEYKTLL